MCQSSTTGAKETFAHASNAHEENSPKCLTNAAFSNVWGSWQDKRSRKAARAGDLSCLHVACKGK